MISRYKSLKRYILSKTHYKSKEISQIKVKDKSESMKIIIVRLWLYINTYTCSNHYLKNRSNQTIFILLQQVTEKWITEINNMTLNERIQSLKHLNIFDSSSQSKNQNSANHNKRLICLLKYLTIISIPNNKPQDFFSCELNERASFCIALGHYFNYEQTTIQPRNNILPTEILNHISLFLSPSKYLLDSDDEYLKYLIDHPRFK